MADEQRRRGKRHSPAAQKKQNKIWHLEKDIGLKNLFSLQDHHDAERQGGGGGALTGGRVGRGRALAAGGGGGAPLHLMLQG